MNGTCYECDGKGWVADGDIEDGMMTGRRRCWVCDGQRVVSLAKLETHVARLRLRFHESQDG